MGWSILGWLVWARSAQAVAAETDPAGVVDDVIHDRVGISRIGCSSQDFEEVVTRGGVESFETPVVDQQSSPANTTWQIFSCLGFPNQFYSARGWSPR